MKARPWPVLGASIVLAAPAALALAALVLESATGIPATRPIDATFAALGVTNASPLPVRQAWYAGTYLLAPLGAITIALIAAANERMRRPLVLVATSGIALALFWTIWSLANH